MATNDRAHRYVLAFAPDEHHRCVDCGKDCHPRSVRVHDRQRGSLCDDCASRVACSLSDVGHALDFFAEYLWHVLPEQGWLQSGIVLGRLLEAASHPAGSTADARRRLMLTAVREHLPPTAGDPEPHMHGTARAPSLRVVN